MNYNKKNLPLYAAILAWILLLAVFAIFSIWKSVQRTVQPETEAEVQTESETRTPAFEALLYKADAASISFRETWLTSDSDTECVLTIEEGTLVALLVTPAKGKVLESVDILDYDFQSVDSYVTRVSGAGNEMRVNFVMPGHDIIVNFNFQSNGETEDAAGTDEMDAAGNETEMETEKETEDAVGGLTLHNLTADIITAFNGAFDDEEFLQAIGEALHVESPRSEYYGVTDVTFSTEPYSGAMDSDKLYYYVYLDDDPDRKILVTYYTQEDAYVFTAVREETEARTETAAANGDGSGSAYSGGVGGQMPAGNASSGTGSQTPAGAASTGSKTGTSFDIMSVSTTFLSYVGGEDVFYEAAWEYVLSTGRTGNIIGTMSGYEIDPEAKKADFTIALSTGGSITGTYSKKTGKFSFSG